MTNYIFSTKRDGVQILLILKAVVLMLVTSCSDSLGIMLNQSKDIGIHISGGGAEGLTSLNNKSAHVTPIDDDKSFPQYSAVFSLGVSTYGNRCIYSSLGNPALQPRIPAVRLEIQPTPGCPTDDVVYTLAKSGGLVRESWTMPSGNKVIAKWYYTPSGQIYGVSGSDIFYWTLSPSQVSTGGEKVWYIQLSKNKDPRMTWVISQSKYVPGTYYFRGNIDMKPIGYLQASTNNIMLVETDSPQPPINSIVDKNNIFFKPMVKIYDMEVTVLIDGDGLLAGGGSVKEKMMEKIPDADNFWFNEEVTFPRYGGNEMWTIETYPFGAGEEVYTMLLPLEIMNYNYKKNKGNEDIYFLTVNALLPPYQNDMWSSVCCNTQLININISRTEVTGSKGQMLVTVGPPNSLYNNSMFGPPLNREERSGDYAKMIIPETVASDSNITVLDRMPSILIQFNFKKDLLIIMLLEQTPDGDLYFDSNDVERVVKYSLSNLKMTHTPSRVESIFKLLKTKVSLSGQTSNGYNLRIRTPIWLQGEITGDLLSRAKRGWFDMDTDTKIAQGYSDQLEEQSRIEKIARYNEAAKLSSSQIAKVTEDGQSENCGLSSRETKCISAAGEYSLTHQNKELTVGYSHQNNSMEYFSIRCGAYKNSGLDSFNYVCVSDSEVKFSIVGGKDKVSSSIVSENTIRMNVLSLDSDLVVQAQVPTTQNLNLNLRFRLSQVIEGDTYECVDPSQLVITSKNRPRRDFGDNIRLCTNLELAEEYSGGFFQLMIRDKEGTSESDCSGLIISREYFVTSSHCYEPAESKDYGLVEISYFKESKGNPSRIYKGISLTTPGNIYEHPLYRMNLSNPKNILYDAMVVKMGITSDEDKFFADYPDTQTIARILRPLTVSEFKYRRLDQFLSTRVWTPFSQDDVSSRIIGYGDKGGNARILGRKAIKGDARFDETRQLNYIIDFTIMNIEYCKALIKASDYDPALPSYVTNLYDTFDSNAYCGIIEFASNSDEGVDEYIKYMQGFSGGPVITDERKEAKDYFAGLLTSGHAYRLKEDKEDDKPDSVRSDSFCTRLCNLLSMRSFAITGASGGAVELPSVVDLGLTDIELAASTASTENNPRRYRAFLDFANVDSVKEVIEQLVPLQDNYQILGKHDPGEN